jgi:hypothetical protein
MNIHVSIHSHPRYLVATDAAALLLLELLLFGASRIRYAISPLAFLLLGIAAVLGCAADVGLWFWKGVRAAELTDDALTVFRGASLSRQAFPRAIITKAKVSRFPGSRNVSFRTLSGRRVRIGENAFSREEFTRFLASLEHWAPR